MSFGSTFTGNSGVVIHFDPCLNVEIDTAIALGCSMTLSRLSQHSQVEWDMADGQVEFLSFRGQTFAYLDSEFAAARLPNDKGMKRLLPRDARAVVACGLADASGLFGSVGDIVAVTDHVNVLGDSPLIGLGNCFPDMSDPYPRRFRETAACVAAERGMKLHEAIYAACPDSTPRPAWTKVFGTCVFGTSIAPVALAAAKDSVPVLGLALLSQARGRSDARETGRSDLNKSFAEFGFECAARLSQQIN